MTLPKIYFKPQGLISGRSADALIDGGIAGRLGGGRVGFTHVEIFSRTKGRLEIIAYDQVRASSDRQLKTLLAQFEVPRAPTGGIDLNNPTLMGIVNVTPDSFSDGGQFDSTQKAVAHGRALVAAGAGVLDIGGESTRPGSEPVSDSTERDRIVPVLRGLRDAGALLSCDTRKSAIMRAAADAGAEMINDVTALTYQSDALATASSLGLPVVLMHSKGEPKTMQDNPEYEDVCLDVFDALLEKIASCEEAGIARKNIIADPGIGFGKTFEHNLKLLEGLAMFHGLGVPLLLGVSRKAFIGALTGEKTAANRVVGSIAAALAGLHRGVQLFRVHDVRETAEAFAVWSGVERQHV